MSNPSESTLEFEEDDASTFLSNAPIVARAQELLERNLAELARRADGRLAALLVIEWAALLAAAVWISPRIWNGNQSPNNFHLFFAAGLGAVISSVPVGLALMMPGTGITRHVIAAAQMLMVGLLIHVTGGRLETHSAYFGILAFLAFYRDWRVLITATLVMALDHLARAALWPQSMYGVASVPFWRPLEHAAWALFEVGGLIDFIRQNRKAIGGVAHRQALHEAMSDDISAEVAARTADLQNSENRYRIMFEHSPLPMWLCDASTLMFVKVNEQAVQKYGYSHDEFLKMHSFDIRPAEDVEAFKAFLDNLADDLGPTRQWRHLKKDGTIIDVEVTLHPVDWNGRRTTLVLAYDISDRKRSEREREAMEVQLRHSQKLESIGQLAAGIAHEINTPTQYIGDNLHFLQDAFRDIQAVVATQASLLPLLEAQEQGREVAGKVRDAMDAADAPYLMEEIPKALEQAIEGVSRVSTLVKAMKDFSHPGQRDKTPFNLNEAIRSTVTVARNEWKYVAELEMDLDLQLPLVPCLVSEFNQVVLNLIVNASHAIASVETSGKLGKIAIRTRVVAGCAEIRVEDSGSGIPVEVRGRIFDPFFTTKEVGKGTGQGLAIARSVVVDKHGGTIQFETEIGKGTSFIIRLPLDGSGLVPRETQQTPEHVAA